MKIKEDITVLGMSCKHCVKAVTDAIKSVEGVKKAKVSLDDKNAVVEYDDEKVALDAIKAAIQEAGFTVG